MANDLKRWLKYRDRFSDAEYLFPTIRGTMLNVNNFEASIRSIGKKGKCTFYTSPIKK